jgi:hypothetical protein
MQFKPQMNSDKRRWRNKWFFIRVYPRPFAVKEFLIPPCPRLLQKSLAANVAVFKN